MAFKIMYGDITTMKVDAIVNSVGIDSRVLGGICRDIVNKAKSAEVEKLLKTNIHGSVFDINVTDAGLLPASHIIHIVTPFKDDDDETLKLLKKAFNMSIEKAIELGYKSIAIPFLGTGANGYNRSDVYQAAASVGQKYAEGKYDFIDIAVTIFNGPENKISNNEMAINNRINAQKYGSTHGGIDGEALLSITMNKIFATMKKSEMHNPVGIISCPYDFIYDYMVANDIKLKKFYAEVFNHKVAYKCKNNLRLMTKEEIYKSALVLEMNRTVFLQLMGYSGLSFNPIDKLDIWMYNYYSHNVIEKSFGDILDAYPDDLNILMRMMK